MTAKDIKAEQHKRLALVHRALESSDSLASQAARLLIEQDNPAYTDGERDALCCWIMQSAEHCDTYLRLVREWRWNVVVYEGGRQEQVNRRLGRLLRSCRQERGLSVEQVARKARISPEEIQQFESGEKQLAFASIVELASGLQMAPSRLVAKLERALSSDGTKKRAAPEPGPQMSCPK